jgi:hypothetical protein
MPEKETKSAAPSSVVKSPPIKKLKVEEKASVKAPTASVTVNPCSIVHVYANKIIFIHFNRVAHLSLKLHHQLLDPQLSRLELMSLLKFKNLKNQKNL